MKDSSPISNAGNERLVVFDFGKSRLGFLDLTSIPTDQSSFDWLRVTAPASWGFIGDVYGLSENVILAMAEAYAIDMPQASKFSVLNLETGLGFHIPISHQPELSINENILGTVFSSNAAIQPDLGLLVAVPWYFPRLDFYDLNGQYQYSSTYDDPKKNKDVYLEGISEASRTNALQRYKGASYSIYYDLDRIMVWSYQSPIDRSENWKKVEVLLRVFDWEGNHLKTYAIQANGNTSFTFDKINNRFIIYDSSDDENNLKAFNIPSGD